MDLIISQELAQQIANYLQGKPYIEVHMLLNEMAKLEKSEKGKE